MPYIWLDIAVAVIGAAVLAAFAWRLFGQVRTLGREVASAAERIGGELAELERASEETGRAGRIVS